MMKTIIKYRLFVLLGCVLLIPTIAQSQHVHSNVVVIDGSKHPELIQDITAYRLFSLNLTQNPGPGRTVAEVHRDRLKPLGLSEQEISASYFTLQDFRRKYDQLAAEYNASERGSAEWDAFVEKRNTLIDWARQELKIYLSPSSLKSLDREVISEKSNMWTQEGHTVSARASRGKMVPASFRAQEVDGCTLEPGYSLILSYTYAYTTSPTGPSTVTKTVTLEGTTTVIGNCTAFHKPYT